MIYNYIFTSKERERKLNIPKKGKRGRLRGKAAPAPLADDRGHRHTSHQSSSCAFSLVFSVASFPQNEEDECIYSPRVPGINLW